MENDEGCTDELGTEPAPALIAEIEDLQVFVAGLPDRDGRSAEDILGYDVRGLPESLS